MKVLAFGAGMQSTALALMSCENAMQKNTAKNYRILWFRFTIL